MSFNMLDVVLRQGLAVVHLQQQQLMVRLQQQQHLIRFNTGWNTEYFQGAHPLWSIAIKMIVGQYFHLVLYLCICIFAVVV